MPPSVTKGIEISGWSAFEGQLEKYKVFADPKDHRNVEWLFRGMRSELWENISSLHRVVSGHSRCDDIAFIESRLVNDYRRRLTNFEGHGMRGDLPLPDVLAMMQHYGAPTRLLDWSYSPYWALFMALYERWNERAPEKKCLAIYKQKEARAAVWVIKTSDKDRGNLLQASMTKSLDRYGVYKKALMSFNRKPKYDAEPLLSKLIEKPKNCVFQLNSQWLNERLSVQQGVFLCLGNPGVDLLENLGDADVELVQLVIDPEAEPEMLRRLYRMGIHAGSAFPGLEGFAKSLAMKVPTYRKMPEDR